MKPRIFLVVPILALVASCTWVEPTLQGQQIEFFEQTDQTVASCTKLGSVTAMVKHRIGPFSRSASKVNSELVTIAQNEAAEMGGDTIVAEGPAENGRRIFAVYRCRE